VTGRTDATEQVLVVGAGPVGLTLAALLQNFGVAVRIIDRSSGPTDRSKAIGVHARTLECMHMLGITDALVSQGNPMPRFRLNQDDAVILAAGFAGIDSAYPFVLGLPQSRTERTLLESLQAAGGRVEWNTELVGLDGVDDAELLPRATLRTPAGEETISCRWLVGCDGSRSAVRERAGIGFPGGDYGNAFILGDVRVTWDGPLDELQFFLSRNGYLLLVPMPNGMHRVIAQTGKRYEDFQDTGRTPPSLADLQAVVNRNGPPGMRVHSPEWVTEAPFYHRRAAVAQRGRVLLAGDAAHLFSPLGAQGLNTGVQDACNLAWKMAFVEQGWAPAGLVATYPPEREPVAAAVGEFTSRTTSYITARGRVASLARKHGSLALNGTAKVQAELPARLAGLQQRYLDSPLVGEVEPGLPVPGMRFPHAWIPGPDGYVPIASLLHSRRFTLLVALRRVSAPVLGQLQEASSSWLREYPFLQTALVYRELESGAELVDDGLLAVEDRLGSVFTQVGRDMAAVLVRPDGVVAFAATGWDPAAVRAYFERAGLSAAPVLQS
jgi:2-polyprenyl-6-methoxyphenol hydroxylase-like FAD-dependent oxidoreductase